MKQCLGRGIELHSFCFVLGAMFSEIIDRHQKKKQLDLPLIDIQPVVVDANTVCSELDQALMDLKNVNVLDNTASISELFEEELTVLQDVFSNTEAFTTATTSDGKMQQKYLKLIAQISNGVDSAADEAFSILMNHDPELRAKIVGLINSSSNAL